MIAYVMGLMIAVLLCVMMAVRRATIVNDESLANKAETPVDLSKMGWISAITGEFYAQNGGTNNQDAHPHDIISKLAVVDGSSVLKQMSGVQAAGIYPFDFGVVPPEHLDESLSVYQRFPFAILFGRYIGDRQFAINAKDFENLQFKIAHDLATVRAVGADSYLTNTAKLTVNVIRFENEELTPKGWFKTEEKKNFTTAAAGIEPVTLPVDHKYRRIFIRSFLTNSALGLSEITLNAGEGKFKPYDAVLPRQLMQDNVRDYHLALEVIQVLHKQNADTFEANLYDTLPGGLKGISGTNHNVGLSENYGLITINLSDLATPTAIAADEAIYTQIGGYRYQNMMCLPLDYGGELFDATLYGGVKLELKQNLVNNACSVLLEELIEGRGLPAV